mmetsp:Transcript_129265/g.335169  ORF Transcript_129265/g.335169 Transcript_129265/m.335169 type:complete len:263 (-) Transcript_129265:1076-1864(-)
MTVPIVFPSKMALPRMVLERATTPRLDSTLICRRPFLINITLPGLRLNRTSTSLSPTTEFESICTPPQDVIARVGSEALSSAWKMQSCITTVPITKFIDPGERILDMETELTFKLPEMRSKVTLATHDCITDTSPWIVLRIKPPILLPVLLMALTHTSPKIWPNQNDRCGELMLEADTDPVTSVTLKSALVNVIFLRNTDPWISLTRMTRPMTAASLTSPRIVRQKRRPTETLPTKASPRLCRHRNDPSTIVSATCVKPCPP